MVQRPLRITLHLPHLTSEAAKELNDALLDAQEGAEVEIGVLYDRVTRCSPRVPGEDYRPLIGTDPHTLIGLVKKVSVGRNGAYVILDATLTRKPLTPDGKPDHEKIGWTTIKGAGIKACQVLKNSAADARRVTGVQ